MFVIIWQFKPKPASEKQFEDAYGPSGRWAQFFLDGDGFLGTELLRAEDGSYLTMDRWSSKETFEKFKAEHAQKYEQLDREFEAMNEVEKRIGEFTAIYG